MVLVAERLLIVLESFETTAFSSMTGRPFSFRKGQRLYVEQETPAFVLVAERGLMGERGEETRYENAYVSRAEVERYCFLL